MISNAYKQTSADKGAKTKLSKYTKKFKQMYGELKIRKDDVDPTKHLLVYQRRMIWDMTYAKYTSSITFGEKHYSPTFSRHFLQTK